MYYPRFTKAIVNYFMAKDQVIPRKKQEFCSYARILQCYHIRVISKHQDIQTKHTHASKGKRIKTSAKGDKPAKKKQSVTKSKGAEKGTVSKQGFSMYRLMNLMMSKSLGSQVKKTMMMKLIKQIEVNEKESDEESDDDSNEDSDEEFQGANIKEKKMDEEATHEEDEANVNNRVLLCHLASFQTCSTPVQTQNLYKALVDAYESDNFILDTYRDTVSFKRHRDDEDKDEEPSLRSNRSKEDELEKNESQPTAGESAQTKEPMHTTKYLEEPAHQEFKTGVIEDQPNEETPQFPDLFQRPTKLPSPDRDWNKTLPDAHGPVQPWLMMKTKAADYRHIKWIKDLSLTECGVKYRLAMTNMHSGESHIRGENDNNSMDLLLTVLEMSTQTPESHCVIKLEIVDCITTSSLYWIYCS
ncbi:hypothetical protein Tco_0408686 [Tanacetum coccineum]